MKDLTKHFLIYLVSIFLLILLLGIIDLVRNDYVFDPVETYLLPADSTPTDILNFYYDNKNDLLFTNSYLITFINYIAIVMLFSVFVMSFRRGWKAPIFNTKNVFLRYSLLLILGIYVFITIFGYVANLLVTQIIVVLFNDIYTSIYVYKIFVENFIWLYMFAIFIEWFANYMKYFNFFNNT